MASSIKYIRKRYHVPAKIGQVVTYNGREYRIAWAVDGALILRDEVRVHPTDPGLDYEKAKAEKSSQPVKGHEVFEAFDRLLALIQSDHVEYNLFLDNDGSHCCELGHWGREPGERDAYVSAWSKTPADAIQAAITLWEHGEQYRPKPEFKIVPPGYRSDTLPKSCDER
jgi:hypothetical protein